MTEDVWIHLSQEQLQEYYKLLDSPDAAAGHLAEVLSLPEYRFDARQAIRLDYASYVLEFAKAQGYGPARTATLFNIAHKVLDTCTGGAAYAQAEASFKGLMVSHVSPRPGADSSRFSPDQVAAVAGFMSKGIFRHYRLYQHCFTAEQAHTEFSAQLLVEAPLPPLPFEVALSQEEWEAHHDKLREEAQAAQKAAEEEAAARSAEEAKEYEERRKQEEEEARKAELERKPATLEDAVKHLVAVRLEAERELLSAEYKAKEEALMAKIVALEATVPAAGHGKAAAAKK